MTENLTWHTAEVDRAQRRGLVCGRGLPVWLTGLPASGKSTVAAGVERHLVESGTATYVLDGDNTRHGLNADLSFSAQDRAENVRRVGEVARLMADAGLVVLVPVIAPYRADRDAVRRIHNQDRIPFAEVYVATPLETCEERDPKGLYAKARAGEMTGLTGIDDPYEEPLEPELRVGTPGQPVAESVRCVVELIAGLGAT